MGLPPLEPEPEIAQSGVSSDAAETADDSIDQDEGVNASAGSDDAVVSSTTASDQLGDPDDDLDVEPPPQENRSSPWDRESDLLPVEAEEIEPDARDRSTERDNEPDRFGPPPTRRNSEPGGGA
jgi:hypothetical protein